MKILLTAAACVLSTSAWAEVPRVVTDIAPVQSLVAQIMHGVGTPDLIVPPAASPHDHAMRPSEARDLANANIVIWMGPTLTPWLEGSIGALAPNATHLALQDHAGTVLPFREGAQFEAHEHEAHDHADEPAEEFDPHMWLDPTNAQAWVAKITAVLIAQDPENKEKYLTNSAEATQSLNVLDTQIQQQLAPYKERSFIVFHDAFHYFEARYDVEAAGAISGSNAQAPSPRRLREIEHVIEKSGAVCVFTEPQFNSGIVDAVSGKVRIGTIDPIGFNLPVDHKMYWKMLQNIADGFEACLSD